MTDPMDPDAPPSEEELAAAESLRVSLEDSSAAPNASASASANANAHAVANADAELLRAIAVALHPAELDPAAQRAAEQAALAQFDRLQAKHKRGVVVRVSFGLGVALAAAAAFAFYVGQAGDKSTTTPATAAASANLVHVRSTQELFSERFGTTGGESARIDRIAIARAADLRENRFAQWGVGGSGHRRGR